ncbi:hypothetical protein [Mesorhizobium argentiipisi]|uniref:Uncharacterized protein n=1 Tax=Mesorhizobium argentiipisi TaxID=3015175 RepID=A0ABU8KFK0_9HYPH
MNVQQMMLRFPVDTLGFAGISGLIHIGILGQVGAAYVDKNIKTWEAMQKVLDSGEHRPTHLRGWKPVG